MMLAFLLLTVVPLACWVLHALAGWMDEGTLLACIAANHALMLALGAASLLRRSAARGAPERRLLAWNASLLILVVLVSLVIQLGTWQARTALTLATFQVLRWYVFLVLLASSYLLAPGEVSRLEGKAVNLLLAAAGRPARPPGEPTEAQLSRCRWGGMGALLVAALFMVLAYCAAA